MTHLLLAYLSLSAAWTPATVPSQLPTPGEPQAAPVDDTLHLEDLWAVVESVDPRFGQTELHERATDLRIRSLETAWYPSVSLQARASHQTEVPTVTLGDPGGDGVFPDGSSGVPTPPRDRYEVAAELEQLLYDGGRTTRRKAVERARLAERSAESRSALYDLREELNGAFFTALLEQERSAQIELLIQDLDARETLVASRLREGTALRSQLAALQAERIRAEQELATAEADRQAALDRLELLLGREVADDEVLAVPDPAPLPTLSLPSRSDGPPDSARSPGESPFTERPEWERMERTRARLRTEAVLADAGDRPRLSLFARGAYGRPGLDFFDDAFSPYATFGARIQWPALEWGGSERDSETLEIQATIVETERRAFEGTLRRRTRAAVHDIDRLKRTLDGDEEVVALREEIEGTARRQLEEGVLLPSDYVETRTDLFEARLVRRLHHIQLAEARVRLRTLLGHGLSAEDLP